jgi:hypothetical protein
VSKARAACLLAASVSALAHGAAAAVPDSGEEPYPPEVTLAPPPKPQRGELWIERPLAFELSSSYAGPYGAVGAALDYSAGPSFGIAAGGGLNPRPLAPRAGIMARIRPLLTNGFASGVEAGVSLGPYTAVEDCGHPRCDDWAWDAAFWGHIALFAGYRLHQGWLLRAAAGASSLFNVADGVCRDCSDGATPSFGVTTLPYVAISVGYALRL